MLLKALYNVPFYLEVAIWHRVICIAYNLNLIKHMVELDMYKKRSLMGHLYSNGVIQIENLWIRTSASENNRLVFHWNALRSVFQVALFLWSFQNLNSTKHPQFTCSLSANVYHLNFIYKLIWRAKITAIYEMKFDAGLV